MGAPKPLNIEIFLEQSGASFIDKYRLMRDRLLNVEYEHWAAGFAAGNNHGRGHITRVLENLDHLLGSKPLDVLDPYELFLAMMAILYHDVGLLKQRKGHEAFSKAFLEGDKNDSYVINAIDKEIIAAAVVSHSSSRDIEEECGRFSPDELIGEHRARPRVIAALVRLADELDEDHRRADAILQRRLDLPEDSAFFWLFCQRVRAIRPNLVAKRIDVNLALEATDTGRFGPLPGGKVRHFVAFCAEKLAKINQERVYVNRFLPPELQYGGLHIDVKPLPGHPKWTSPRTFVFNDKTTAEMLLRGFPELLDDPARKEIQAALELMRLEKLDEAERKLDGLASVNADLPADVQISIPYERACIQSFRAKHSGAGTPGRDAALDAAEKFVIEWYRRGHDGGWDAIGRTAAAEVHRMASDGDLAFVRRMRGPRLKEAIPASLWPAPKGGGGGGGGCVPIGALIDTPAGPRQVEDLRPGDPILSFNPADSTCVQSTVTEVRTSRSPCCICLNHGWLATPGQRIRVSGGWVRVGGLQPGDRVVGRGGSLVAVLSAVPHSGYFETYDLSVAGPYHNYVADGLLCHNNPEAMRK